MNNYNTIIDFISGEQIKATPEEVDAVQVFSKQLVDDYGYPRENIQTRPQYRVKQRPSGKADFPVDIMVFTSKNHDFQNEYIIVECKRKTRLDGKTQLEDYLRFSKAKLGVWFNGEQRLFLRKYEKDGESIFQEIPNIPKYGQRIEDIGKFKRKDLRPTHNLKTNFKSIRNYLAANTTGATRDETLAQQLINLIFCKIYDERFTEPENEVTFRAGVGESNDIIKKRIIDLFNKVKEKYKDVIDKNDNIELDESSLVYVIGELQDYCLIDVERDVIADAFETFIGHALKGGQGQFFTPRNLVKMMVNIVDPGDEDLIIDPACGSGGFLVEALRHVWNKIESKGQQYDWNDANLNEEKMKVALTNIKGIDKDYFLSKVAKAYMAIIGDGRGGIFCEDSLEKPAKWGSKTKIEISLEKFDVLVTNPPFGTKIPVTGEEKLSQYDLAHQWQFDGATSTWVKGKLKQKEPPQILFIERALQFLRDQGRAAIVLPEGIYGNESLAYIRNWLLKHARILAIIDVPLETFMPNTGTKTSVLVLQKTKKEDIPDNYPIFLAHAEYCGHDRRGKEIPMDDFTAIPGEFKKWMKENNFSF